VRVAGVFPQEVSPLTNQTLGVAMLGRLGRLNRVAYQVAASFVTNLVTNLVDNNGQRRAVAALDGFSAQALKCRVTLVRGLRFDRGVDGRFLVPDKGKCFLVAGRGDNDVQTAALVGQGAVS